MLAQDKAFGAVQQKELRLQRRLITEVSVTIFWGGHQGMQNPYDNIIISTCIFIKINTNLEVTIKSYVVQGGFNSWVLRGNPLMWPFKWKLLSSTFLWYCLLCFTCKMWLWLLGLLRRFDPVFWRPYQYFSTTLQVILSLSSHYKIFSTDWLWIEVC